MKRDLFEERKTLGRKCRPFSIAFKPRGVGREDRAEKAFAEILARNHEHKKHGTAVTIGERVQQKILQLIENMTEKEALKFIDKVDSHAENLSTRKLKTFREAFLIAEHPSEILELIE